MKLTLQRALSELINFLLALLFVLPLGIFLEQACGLTLFHGCFLPCLALIGHCLGRMTLRSEMGRAMLLCGVGFASATVLALILAIVLQLGLGGVLLTLLTALCSVFFFFTARKAAYTIYAPMAVSGILMHLLVLLLCEGLGWDPAVGRFASTAAIGFFLLSLFAFSSKGLRRSMHRGSGEQRVSYPAGVQMGNFLLVTGFILVAAFVSNIYPMFRVFSRGFGYVLGQVFAFFRYLSAFLATKKSYSPLVEETTDQVNSSEENIILNAEAKGEASWITQGVEIFAFICLILFCIYALYKLVKKLQSSGVRLPGFLRNLRDRFAPVVAEDYVDEAESLFDMKKLLGDTRNNMASALKKLRERPQKLEDFPDARLKVRFAFQQLLKKAAKSDQRATSRTPNELGRTDFSGDQEAQRLLGYYNEARYSPWELPPEAVEAARAVAKRK